ncbi:MAG TPA: S41 family peptidase [Gemmatales bacterium]|nr:S41 family peptidase [Gemmatales bacterium]
MSYFLLLLALLVPQQDPATRAGHWKEDLAFFADNFKTRHIKPFTKITEAQFGQAIQDIDPDKLTDQQIVMKLWQLLARVGDSHSRLNPPRIISFTQYPIAFIYLTDGWYVFAVDQAQQQALEGKLLKIGDTPVEQACQKLGSFIASENASQTRGQLPRFMQMTQPLHEVGLVADPLNASFTLRTTEGKETTISLEPITRGPANWKFAIKPETWLEHLKQARPQHGFTWLEDKAVLYVWYDRCTEFPTYPIKKWTQDVIEQIDEKKPKKVIVDLRRNGGGNSQLLEPLINSLAKKEVNDKNRLYVLIGPATFSSAMMNAQHFKTRTKAILVGEPTGGSPNHFGEVKTFTLPHSKCVVQYSTKQFRMTNDNATTIEPHLEIKQTAKGFFADKDEVLEAVIKK